VKIINFQNLNIQNPFNPNFSYHILENKTDFDNIFLTKFLLNKEEQIKNMYPGINDGGTDLGESSVTSRFINYNLLEFPETIFLKTIIRKNHDDFLKNLNITIDKNYYVQCWFNVLRKGEKITKHSHYPLGRAEESFISGHFCVNALNTNTYYLDVGKTNEFPVKNEIGQLSLFPSYLVHWSDTHPSNEPRITIAFDVYFKKRFIRNNDFIKRKIVIPLTV